MMQHKSVGVAILCLTAVVASSGVARAQTNNVAAAEALFEQARGLMKTGDYVHACPKFKESQRLDPASGTLLNLAFCYENEGKTATAWATFKEASTAASRDGHASRVKFANQHIKQLKPLLSKLTVTVDDRHKVAGLTITTDGTVVGNVTWGVALPADPGEHVVEAKAPGRRTWSKKIVVGKKGDNQVVSIPLLEKESGAAAGNVASVNKPAGTSATTPANTSGGVEQTDQGTTGGAGSNQATWGYVAGGAGIVALGVGATFGLVGLSKWKERNDNCHDSVCNPTGLDAGKAANTDAYISDIGIGVGLVGIGAGAYLLLTAPSGESADEQDEARVSVSPQVGRGFGGVTIGGSW